MTRRVTVITGAGRGLGLGLSKAFAAKGDRVVGTARNPDQSEALSRIAERVVTLDVSSDDSIEAAAAELADLERIDLLINNAGLDGRAVGAEVGGRGPLELSREAFLAQVDVNAVGPLLVTRALLPMLDRSPQALVVNISSQLGAMSFGADHGGDIGYNASKSALNMVTVRTATELAGRNIAMVSVHPGWVQTDMGGPSASLTIEDSATAIADTVDGLGFADSGRFLRWDGSDHPW